MTLVLFSFMLNLVYSHHVLIKPQRNWAERWLSSEKHCFAFLRRPMCGIQHPHGYTQPLLTPAQRSPTLLSIGRAHMVHLHTSGQKHIHMEQNKPQSQTKPRRNVSKTFSLLYGFVCLCACAPLLVLLESLLHPPCGFWASISMAHLLHPPLFRI